MVLLIWELVDAAITGALIIPLFVLWICGLIWSRRRGDPARTGFRYLHIVVAFEILALVLNVIAAALTVARGVISSQRSYNRESLVDLSYSASRTYLVRTLFEMVATVLAFVMFTELGNGFDFARTGARSGAQKVLRYVSIATAIVLMIVGIAYFGVANATQSAMNSGRTLTSYYLNGIRNVWLLLGSFYVLVFIVSILLLVHAAMTVHKVRHLSLLRNSAVLYLVAVVFFFIRYLYRTIYSGLWLLAYRNLYSSSSGPPNYMTVIDAIFNDVFFFICLVLVISMGFRKNGGLASTSAQASYIPNQQVMYTMPQQGYYPQQQPQMQQGWQYPQGQPQQHYMPSQYPSVEQQPVQQPAHQTRAEPDRFA